MNWNIIKRLDFWFGMIGVLGVVFSIFTYFHTEKHGELSYSILTQKIFDPNNLRGFKLLSPDGSVVNQQVFASEVVLWNSGDLSLSAASDRIRDPVTIALSNGLINYFVIGSLNFVNSDNYTIALSNDQKSANIRWTFFDPGQGIRLTFVHSGVSEINDLTVTGKFFEATLVSRTVGKTPGFEKIRSFMFVVTLIGCAISFIIGALLLFRHYMILRSRKGEPAPYSNTRLLFLGLAAMGVSLLYGLLLIFLMKLIVGPPV
jgi:hypothetical protein